MSIPMENGATMMDVIFLSSSEPNRQANYERACSVFKKTLKHVQGQDSLLSGFKEAARLSSTPLFVLIDGDNIVYDHAPEVLSQVDKPSVFQAENYLGMSYGHGGIKVLSKEQNWQDFEELALDVSYHLNLSPQTDCLSYHEFERYPMTHFKTVFKELLKLHLKRGQHQRIEDLLNHWLRDPRNVKIFEEVKDYLNRAKFNSLHINQVNQYVNDYYPKTFKLCLTAILGDDLKWLEGFGGVIDHFDDAFILDTGSKDGSWAKLKKLNAGYPQLHIRRKRFWKKDFSRFRNACHDWALSQIKDDRTLFAVVDMDERLVNFRKENLIKEVLFSRNPGARFDVTREEWHGAYSNIPRVFYHKDGNWDGPIHETFWYKSEIYNSLNPIESLRLKHLKSEDERLKEKGKRDLKILRRCVHDNPKRYLYFIFESLDKMGKWQEIIDEFLQHENFILNELDPHYQLLIHKYVINSYSLLKEKCPKRLIVFMREQKYRSVYYQLIKALMEFEENKKICHELYEEMITFSLHSEEPIYLKEAFDKKELERVERNLYN